MDVAAILISVVSLAVSIVAFRTGGIAELTARVTELPDVEAAFEGYMLVQIKNLGLQTAHKVMVEIDGDPEHA